MKARLEESKVPTSQRVTPGILKRRTFGTLVLIFFGTFWAFCGLVALNSAAGWLPLIVVCIIAILLFAASMSLYHAMKQIAKAPPTAEEKISQKNYLLINVLQVAAMSIASLVWSLTRHPELILPSLAFIMGLHFFALVSILQRKLYYIIGLAICSLGCLTLLFLPSTAHIGRTQVYPWIVVIGFGDATILWSTVVETLLQVRTKRQWVSRHAKAQASRSSGRIA